MRIVLVCKVYPTQRPGGMGFVCQDRARELVQQGHDVHVLTTGKRGQAAEINDNGVAVHHLECKEADYSDEFAQGLVRSVNNLGPDILHLDSFDSQRPWWRELKTFVRSRAITMHGFCWGAYFTDLNLCRRGVPRISSGLFDMKKAGREAEYLRDFGTVIGISRHEHWMLHQLMGIEDAKLVYNPIPNYFFDPAPKPLPSGKPRFLCAAVSSYGVRGFDYAAKAAEKAGVELATIHSAAREEIPAILDSCHGLVLPTAYAQGMDLTVAEALARRRRVIVTATGSYLRESEPGGIYNECLQLVPLVNPVDAIAAAMQKDPEQVWAKIGNHLPDVHVDKWLGAILG